MEQLFEDFDSKVISKNETRNALTAKVSFKFSLYTGETSNESFFDRICRTVAEFENYKNFELEDTAKDIKIEVICENFW